LNPVPCIFYDNSHAGEYDVKADGSYGLSNVAATVANLLGFEAPDMWDASMIDAEK
jgi:2,3-bisphosphoglycerate-independent phosphoglycerate mutase